MNEIVLYGCMGILLIPLARELGESALVKRRDGIRLFESAIAQYKLAPTFVITPLARGIICCETGLAILLLLPFKPILVIAAAGLVGLGAVFVSAQLSALVRGLKISCGCHGHQSDQVGLTTLRVPIFMIASGAGILSSLSGFSALGLDASRLVIYLFSGIVSCLLVQIMQSMKTLMEWRTLND